MICVVVELVERWEWIMRSVFEYICMGLNVEGMLRMERCLDMDLRVHTMGLNGEVMLRMERHGASPCIGEAC